MKKFNKTSGKTSGKSKRKVTKNFVFDLKMKKQLNL